MGLEDFKCARCGACCRWEGYVRVTQQEIDAIAEYLKIPLEEFLREHTRLTHDRQSLSLLEKEDGSCCYYDEENHCCLIQSVKPQQCKDFPYKWNFPGWEELCGGSSSIKEDKTS